MISKYKLKIIISYTGLLFAIIVTILGLVYSILGFQLKQEIDQNLQDKSRRIESWLDDPERPIDCDKEFFRRIFSSRRVDLSDIIEQTEKADDKYVLILSCSSEIMYISEKYEYLNEHIDDIKKQCLNETTLALNGTAFSFVPIHKNGYSLYIGYELSTIKAVQKKIVRIFLASFPFVVIASIIFVFLVTQRLMRVIHTITQTTAGITSKNLSERIPMPAGKDEITNLIATINAMIDRLEKSFILIRQFSQDAAHELRTPLTIIRGEIENMMTKKLSKDNAKSLDSILEEIHYLSSIVNKLLLLHSLDTGENKHHFNLIDITHILEYLKEDAIILAKRKDIDLKLEMEEGLYIKGNEELINQMIWNIMDNAIKYTPANGEVKIHAKLLNNNVNIKISDTGIGIPESEINKIFTRFYRVEQSHSREIGGSGLGLSISKWIAELHKGNITAESIVNKGSDFTIIMPAETNINKNES